MVKQANIWLTFPMCGLACANLLRTLGTNILKGRFMQRIWLTALAVFLFGCSPAERSSTELASPAEEQVQVSGNQADALYVAAEFDDESIRLHYRLEVESPSWYHQYWVYRDGSWQVEGSGADGPDPNGLYEDRISMLLDDGQVQGFDRFGGFMLVHPGMRSLDNAASPEQVRAHPLLGEQMGRSDVRKYLPQSRNVDYYSDPARWDDTKSSEALEAMQDAGEFLDLWQWRAHRSNPIGYADNGYVLHYRLNSEGQSMFATNEITDEHTGETRPEYMFDAEQVGHRALTWDALLERAYSQDDAYYLSEATAVAFDPEHEWQEGDVLPYRRLQTPSGSRGAIKAQGRYADGYWRVTLTRTLDSPNPSDSKTLAPGELYHVAFAVHHGGVGARHHRVSLPQSLGLDLDADIVASYSEQPLPDDALAWQRIELVNPHQVDWEWLVTRHQGANFIRGDMPIGVRDQHGHVPAFQRYLDRYEARRKQQQER